MRNATMIAPCRGALVAPDAALRVEEALEKGELAADEALQPLDLRARGALKRDEAHGNGHGVFIILLEEWG